MNSAKIISIEEVWKRAKEKGASSETTPAEPGAESSSEDLPKAGEQSNPVSTGNAMPPVDSVEENAGTTESEPEVRFEKIIKVKKRIENNYYEGDRVGMDILRAIFSDSDPEEKDGTTADGDQDDAGDS